MLEIFRRIIWNLGFSRIRLCCSCFIGVTVHQPNDEYTFILQEDRMLNQCGKAATKKLKMLPTVISHLRKYVWYFITVNQ